MDDEDTQSCGQTTNGVKNPIASTAMKPNPDTSSAIAYSPESDPNPMMLSSYLLSPLETILESLDDQDLEYISLHDLVEAYNVLSIRLRSQMQAILRAEQPPATLSSLKECAMSLARALKRDIRRALVDPSHHFRPTLSHGESFLTEVSMSDHEIQYARNLTTLCHHGLLVLSDIFAFEPLYSLFHIQDLQELLSELLNISLTSTLPTPNANKTWSLVLWVVQTQTLPSNILNIKKAGIVLTLQQAISESKGHQAKLDGLKAIHNLSKHYPDLFVSPLLNLLPTILLCLISENTECRLQAGYALSGFALAKIRMTSEFPCQNITVTLQTFINKQTSKQKPSPDELHLPSIIHNALSSLDTDPYWALIVVASLIVLLDASLFSHPRSLKLCLSTLELAAAHKRSPVRALHICVWRSLVWAFSRMPSETTTPKSANQNTSNMIDIRERVFRVIKQELKGGIGVSLVTVLLGQGDTEPDPVQMSQDVTRALLILKEMMAGDRRSDPYEATQLLNRLVSAIGTSGVSTAIPSAKWYGNIKPASGLFDGSILDASTGKRKDVIGALSEVKIDSVRTLSESELVHHWDALVDIWIESVERVLRSPSAQLPREVLHIWQSLLLVKADLTQDRAQGHLTASSTFASRVASIITRFLVFSEDVETQIRQIITVTKLWAVTKNVYSSSWLSPLAEVILAAILKLEYFLLNEDVKIAWSQLCARLISVGVPTLLHVIFTRSESKDGLQVTRQLWIVLAKTWKDLDRRPYWQDLVSLLLIPLRSWAMSSDEFELWEGTLHSAVGLAGLASIKPTTVIEWMLERTNEGKLKGLVSSPRSVSILLSHVDLSDRDTLPKRIFSTVDQTLTSHYPPQPEELAPCLEILRLLGQVISSTPGPLIVRLLCAIEKAMCCWIGDETEAMLVAEHNDIVTTVYCRALQVLRNQEPTVETLVAISPFLSSAFGRLPQPAIGPLAFNEFWRATYHKIVEHRPFYPDCLKACLLGFKDAYGGSIGDGLSAYSESQKTRMSIVPDSQPFHQYAKNSFEHEVDYIPHSSHGETALSATHVTTHLPTQTPIQYTSPEPQLKRQKLDHLTALRQLQEYSSYGDEDAIMEIPENREVTNTAPGPTNQRGPSFGLPTPLASGRTINNRPSAPQLKRPTDASGRPSQKRRKTDPEHSQQSAVQRESRVYSDSEIKTVTPLNSLPDMPSISLVSSERDSQDTNTRKRKRVLNWVNSYADLENIREHSQSSIPRQGEVASRTRSRSGSSTPSSEEYNSWEVGMSTQEIRELQRELAGSDHPIPETDTEDIMEFEEGTEPLSDVDEVNLPYLTSRRQDHHRSQTVPVTTPSRPTHLRRNQTTSARIHALERAYTVVADGASQVPVEDLVHAAGWVNKIHTTLNEQIVRRLAGSGGADQRT